MNDTILQLTKRELQAHLTSVRFWTAMFGGAFLLGLVGPFGTFENLSFSTRLAYWFVVAVSTYLLAFGVSKATAEWCVARFRVSVLIAYALGGAVAGVPVAFLVMVINAIAFGWSAEIFGGGALLLNCIVISAIVAGLVAMFSIQGAEKSPTQASNIPEEVQIRRPLILDRLPNDQRGRLSHMTMQDHYVDIRTDKGGALVLMRFADAIAETQGVDGLQIHRSHWVAKQAVMRLVRKDGRIFLQMRDDTLLPVSRTYIAAVRASNFV